MNLLESISNELKRSDSDYASKKYILAVSGGIDSMVILDCFAKLNLEIEVAHYNFQLRGNESNGDEELVRSICSKNQISFNVATEDTNNYANENNLSIQEAARELRYNWFFELLKEKKANYIVTAHHADDSIETFFINLLRGSGIKGLTGIKNNRQILRPLISSWRKSIDKYAVDNNIEFRNDSSNESLKYKRNFIRKKIVPELNEEQESASSSILKSIRHLNQANDYLSKKLKEDVQKITAYHENETCIDTSASIEQIVLYAALSKYGFNETQVISTLKNLESVGSQHYSATHELLINRGELIIKSIKKLEAVEIEISGIGNYNNPISLTIENIERPTSFKTEKNTIYLDTDKISFPLQLRKWKEGDWFIPFGMKGKKKLSDFFIDEKLSRFEKENTWLLLSNNQIVWVVNHRLDNRFKINASTKNIIQVVTK